jgi:hypothetical protein
MEAALQEITGGAPLVEKEATSARERLGDLRALVERSKGSIRPPAASPDTIIEAPPSMRAALCGDSLFPVDPAGKAAAPAPAPSEAPAQDDAVGALPRARHVFDILTVALLVASGSLLWARLTSRPPLHVEPRVALVSTALSGVALRSAAAAALRTGSASTAPPPVPSALPPASTPAEEPSARPLPAPIARLIDPRPQRPRAVPIRAEAQAPATTTAAPAPTLTLDEAIAAEVGHKSNASPPAASTAPAP